MDMEIGEEIGVIKDVTLKFRDRVTFTYDGDIRIGTAVKVKGYAILMNDDDRDGKIRSFSGVKIHNLLVL